MIPHWLKSYLNDDGLKKIENAVKAAEHSTAGEIVPMVVRRSAMVSHCSVLLGSILLVFWCTFCLTLLELEFIELGHVFLITAGVVVIVILSQLFQLFPLFSTVQRTILLLFSKSEMINAVHINAVHGFYESGLTATRDATGVLIFISLLERRAVVLADRAIAAKLPPETWQQAVQLLVDGARRKDLAGGFVDAINHCSAILKQHFPIKPDDHNELADILIIKDF